MLLVEVTSESPTNEAESEASTPDEHNGSGRRVCFKNFDKKCTDATQIEDFQKNPDSTIGSEGLKQRVKRKGGRRFRREGEGSRLAEELYRLEKERDRKESGEASSLLQRDYDQSQDDEEVLPYRRDEIGYVGLVNQAMTCYLNSLLQALYMTPEFRNALYNWEYVHDSDKDQAKSIPYQLQKLFLNLQTSTKHAIETTSLTKSFGWDSTEAWQQHDIQELCRVMFEALEQKFKNTDQADLINRLYEGKMIDYVKCLECGTEKSREDTFLDIPLPVRPFGNNAAYNSVEEALRAFVQPEILDGTNQYHCETCNKKCDAHKGLKFKKFPYFLTLHLKRFDFDYNTFHRIKLNDEVTFPDTLNLNSFIPPATTENSVSTEECSSVDGVKADDSSTMDSGTADDDTPSCKNGKFDEKSSESENHEEDEDEGIERSNGPSTSNCNSVNHDSDENRDNEHGLPGPYIYELFSIMIHSGSASGGHYYAYIKDFRTNKWFSFNDQNVTPITHDDIQKTYGGGPARAYYSGVYSSSSNAYMLMYRQIDPERNTLPMQIADFPKHIQALLLKMQEGEDTRRQDWEISRKHEDNDGENSRKHEDNDAKNVEMWMLMCKLVLYCHHPVKKTTVSEKLFCLPDETWDDLTQQAYKAFRLENVCDRDQVRLVTYDASTGTVESSFEGRENESLRNLLTARSDFLLEICGKDQTFVPYPRGSFAKKIYVVNITTKQIVKGPITFRGRLTQTILEYKEELSPVLGIPVENLYLVPKFLNIPAYFFVKNSNTLQKEDFQKTNKIFVPVGLSTEINKDDIEDTIILINNLISFNVQLPNWSKEELEFLGIPSLEDKKVADASPVTNKPQKPSSVAETPKDTEKVENNEATKTNDAEEVSAVCNKTTNPAVHTEEDWHTPEQSNSEDSSLTFSYSDRTLMGDGDVSEDDEYLPLGDNEFSNQNNQDNGQVEDSNEYVFQATRDEHDPDKLLRVLVDRRMVLGTLKKFLEPYVGIPAEYFKVSCQPAGEFECTSAEASFHEDGITLRIKPGLALRNDEFKVILYQLCLDSEIEPFKFLCEWTVSKDATIGQIKKKILMDLRRKFDIDIPIKRCRIRRKIFDTAGSVFLDDKKAKDFRIFWPREIIVQQLPDKETVIKQTDVVIFSRRVSSPGIQIGPIQEIVLSEKTMKELHEKVSKLSGIPLEFLEVALGRTSLPDEGMLLIMQKCLVFNRHTPGIDDYNPLGVEDGTVIYYRDNRESMDDVYKTDASDGWSRRAPRAYGSSSTRKSHFSPRRERALKIHIDDM